MQNVMVLYLNKNSVKVGVYKSKMNPGETHQALTEFSVIQNWPYMALKISQAFVTFFHHDGLLLSAEMSVLM